MKNANKKKKGLRKNFFVVSAVFILSLYIGISFAGQQIKLSQEHQRLKNIKKTYAEEVEKNNSLKRLLANQNNAEYLERIARDKFGYVSPDEKVFIDISGE